MICVYMSIHEICPQTPSDQGECHPVCVVSLTDVPLIVNDVLSAATSMRICWLVSTFPFASALPTLRASLQFGGRVALTLWQLQLLASHRLIQFQVGHELLQWQWEAFQHRRSIAVRAPKEDPHIYSN